MINRQILVDRIQSVIDTNANTGYTSEEIVSLVLAIQSLKENNIIVVETIEKLPDLLSPTTYIANGSVYFVQENLIHVIKLSNRWMTLDGATARIESQHNIFGFGQNNYGKLGNNSTSNFSSPVSVVGGFTDWCQVSSTNKHTLAVRKNGTLWAWGNNDFGRLGNNYFSVISRSSPVSVVGGFNDWCQSSAGGYHSLAVRTNGTAWAWGRNRYGRLGNGLTVDRSSPVLVAGGFTDWCQVSAACEHSLGLRKNGTVWAWGRGTLGRLGNGLTADRSSPVSVVGGFTDWCQVSAGDDHNVAVRQNGTIWTWGAGNNGQLGDGTVANKSSPVSVIGGFTDWCQVSASPMSSFFGGAVTGVRRNGTLWTWGRNLSGRLGDGTTVDKSSPVSVIGGFTDWCQVSTGFIHTLAIRQNGTLWAWGNNTCAGQLGDGTTVNTSSPVSVVGGFTDWCQVSAGVNSSLAIKSQ